MWYVAMSKRTYEEWVALVKTLCECESCVKHRSNESRKPGMSEARRKVLNLLEFCLESEPDAYSVFNMFCLHVAQRDEDHIWAEDEEWAEWFQDYANKLIKKNRETNDEL